MSFTPIQSPFPMDVSLDEKQEPLLVEEKNRFVTFPILHRDIWEFYKKQVSVFWTPEEIKLADDMNDWDKLNDNEKHFISNVLAFFAASDGIVNENLGVRFMNEIQWVEAKNFYGFQIAMENIHSETYSLLIETYIQDTKEKDRLLNAVDTVPCVKEKAHWAMKYIESTDSFATRLVAFALVEGLFFSGSFCAIFWLKKRGIMPGLCFSNELISRDEGMHCEFACFLYKNYIVNRLSNKDLHTIVKDAVEIEKKFITDSLPCNLIGMNADSMKQYIEYVADRLCEQLGHPKIWNTNNPFPWMIQQGMQVKANFFENRVAAYEKAHIGRKEEDKTFELDGEF